MINNNMMNVKNLAKVARESKSIEQSDRGTWLPLYYDIDKNAVYTRYAPERWHLTDLIRPCTKEEVAWVVHKMRWI